MHLLMVLLRIVIYCFLINKLALKRMDQLIANILKAKCMVCYLFKTKLMENLSSIMKLEVLI